MENFNKNNWQSYCREWRKHKKKLEEWKALKKIQEVKTMLEQNKKMDKSQQRMEHLQLE